MSGVNLFSWITSTVVHVGLLVGLMWFQTAAPVELPEMAGNRSVISTAYAPPKQASATAETVTIEPQPINEPTTSLSSFPDLPPIEPIRSHLPRVRLPMTVAQLPTISRVHVEVPTPTTSKIDLHYRPEFVEPTPKPLRHDVPLQRKAATIKRQDLAKLELPDKSDTAASSAQAIGTTETAPATPRHNPRPVYPSDAVGQGIEGRVLLQITISAEGRVSRLEVARSSGNQSLDKAAQDAVIEWRFSPARRDGKPVEWTVHLSIWFRLN